MKKYETSGALLDLYVGLAIGRDVELVQHPREEDEFCIVRNGGRLEGWAPTVDWNVGGPLLQKYFVGTEADPHQDSMWKARCGIYIASGESPLIAGMRALVYRIFGEEEK